jgi:ankyrin repeat protein
VLLDSGANANAENNEGKAPLHLVSQGDCASQENGVGIVRALLQHGVDIHAKDIDHDTPLHSAAFSGMLEIARVLLNHGANVNAENKSGRTPLHQVAQGEYDSQECSVGIARLLVERGVDVQSQDKDHDTALHAAAFTGRLEMAKLLIDSGAITTAENEHGEIPLHLVSRGQYISQENSVGIVQLLLECGVDVNAQEKHGWTSLHWAAFKGRVEVAQVLLGHGANAKLETEKGETALNLASLGEYDSEENGVSVVQLLLRRGVDVNAQDKDAWTSLHWAAFKGRVEVAQVLLDHGANAKLETEEGETALNLASQGEYDSEENGVSVVRLLLGRGVDVNAQDKDAWTSLHWAAFKGRVEVAQVLLDHGANAKLETEEGETALNLASQGEYDSEENGVSVVRLLLGRGVDVNAQDKDAWTSLHWAALKGMLKVTQVLLDHGANAKLETEKGETALHLVSRGEYDSEEHGVSVARLLLERGVDVNAQDKVTRTSLHWAAFKWRVEVAQVLLDHGANPKLETEGVETALHIVSQGKYDSKERGVGIARLLLEHGVDVHAKGQFFTTALHYAALNGNLEIVQVRLFFLKNIIYSYSGTTGASRQRRKCKRREQ